MWSSQFTTVGVRKNSLMTQDKTQYYLQYLLHLVANKNQRFLHLVLTSPLFLAYNKLHSLRADTLTDSLLSNSFFILKISFVFPDIRQIPSASIPACSVVQCTQTIPHDTPVHCTHRVAAIVLATRQFSHVDKSRNIQTHFQTFQYPTVYYLHNIYLLLPPSSNSGPKIARANTPVNDTAICDFHQIYACWVHLQLYER